MKTDILSATKSTDRGETTSTMEPLLIGADSRHRGTLTDLAFDLTQSSAGFRRSLPPGMLASLAGLVRAMNCYYSNLIEGHNTHPIDIERALKDDYSQDRRKRDLQLEAKAHIAVQKWIDEGGLKAIRPFSKEGICQIHRRFCELLPDDLLWVEDLSDQGTPAGHPRRVAHGRRAGRQSHRYQPRCRAPLPEPLRGGLRQASGRPTRCLPLAAAHHRVLWIHPFLDGNGRVARLMSHAMLLDALDTGAVWSAARGLARNETTYKQLLANCDRPRRNDLDGRGNLSEEAWPNSPGSF